MSVAAAVENPQATPYAHAARIYRELGWQGILPLPEGEKSSPPTGYTGDDGAWPTDKEIDGWARAQPRGNVGLRLPDGIIGIDVDHYGPKRGGDTIAHAEEKLGPLPATWVSTARGFPSGIRLYQVPEGRKYKTPGSFIDVLQRHHRYACVWPSHNPKANAPYLWITPTGEVSPRPPAPHEVPWLPETWVETLDASKPVRPVAEPRQRDNNWHAPAVDRALAKALSNLYANRHDSATAGVLALVRLHSLDFPGADDALSTLQSVFLAAVTGDGSRSEREAAGEWQRMVTTAEAEVLATPSTTPRWEDRPGGRHLASVQPAPTPPVTAPEPAPAVVDATPAPDADPASEGVGEFKPEEVWATPEPFEPKMKAGPLFPLEVLPEWIARRVSDVSREVSVPVDYAAISALGTLSAIAMNRVTLDLSERRTDLPLSIWLAAAGESGVSKSYPFEQMTAPLWAYIDHLASEGAQRRAEAEASLTIAEKKLKELEQRPQSSQGAPTVADLGEARMAAEGARNAIPPDPHFIVDDATPEAVAEHYRDCGEIAAIFDDEGSVIDMMAGQYAKDTAAVGPYISGYDRTPINARRVGRGRVTVRRPCLTVCVMTQPMVLAKLGKHSYLAGKGIVPRFLLANPPDTRGWRAYENQMLPYDPTSKQTYESTMLDLAKRLARSGHHTRLKATDEAFRRWIEWNQENEPRLRRGGDLRRMVAWYEKIRTATFRTAALLQLADHPHDHNGVVGVKAFERAFVLAEYWVAHAKVLMDAWVDRQIKDDSGIGRRARSVLEWTIEQGHDEVSFSAVRKRLHDNSGLSKDEIIPIIEWLAEGGWVRVPEGFAQTARTKRPLTITIHPEAARHLQESDEEAPELGLRSFLESDSPDSPECTPPASTCMTNRGNRGIGVEDVFATSSSSLNAPEEERDQGTNEGLTPDPPIPPIRSGPLESPKPESAPPSVVEPVSAPNNNANEPTEPDNEGERFRLWD